MKFSKSFAVCAVIVFGLALSTPDSSMGMDGMGMDNNTGPQPINPMLQSKMEGDPSRHTAKVEALLELRREGLRMREADGGTLTAEHLAYLQHELDQIQSEYPEH